MRISLQYRSLYNLSHSYHQYEGVSLVIDFFYPCFGGRHATGAVVNLSFAYP